MYSDKPPRHAKTIEQYMIKIIFSGINKAFFNNLAFNKSMQVTWLSIDELASVDFALSGDKNTKFILFYTSPECFLSSINNEIKSESSDTVELTEQKWQPQTQLLMQFYLANKGNAVLFDSEQFKQNINTFNELIQKKFKVKNQLILATNNKEEQTSDIGEQLLNQSLQLSILSTLSDHYEIQETFESIKCAADLLTANENYSIEERSKYYLETNIPLVKNIVAKNEKSVKENELLLLQLQQLQGELETVVGQQKESEAQLALSKNKVDKMSVELTNLQANNQLLLEEKSAFENTMIELTSENELSLLQIFQLQKELETVVGQQKESETQLTLNKRQVVKVEDELESLQTYNHQLSTEIETLANSHSELTAENELSVLQIHQLQQELEMVFVQSEQLADSKAENEIALLQIQQLQEELEFYFIKYQSMSNWNYKSTLADVNNLRFKNSLKLVKHLNS